MKFILFFTLSTLSTLLMAQNDYGISDRVSIKPEGNDPKLEKLFKSELYIKAAPLIRNIPITLGIQKSMFLPSRKYSVRVEFAEDGGISIITIGEWTMPDRFRFISEALKVFKDTKTSYVSFKFYEREDLRIIKGNVWEPVFQDLTFECICYEPL